MEPITDVLIVGSGPTGLALAIDLQRFGINFKIIDKDEGLASESRALGIHSRTLEMLEQRDLEKEFLNKGLKAIKISINDNDTEIGALEIADLKVPYPFVLVLPQSASEQILYRRLKETNVEVAFEHELISFIQKDNFVEATVRTKNGDFENIRAKWLIGCDGAKSKVREILAVDISEDTIEELFLLADLEINWERPKDSLYLWMDKEGVAGTIPLPEKGKWRVILNYPAQNKGYEPTEDFFEKVFRNRSGQQEVKFRNSTWISTFKIQEKHVHQYRIKRAFLVGDAAHIHSPLGAQGMNIGIQDAFNLAWKLSMVIKGIARNSLLKTYEEERKSVAEKVIFFTGASTTAMTSRNFFLRFVRNKLLKGIGNFSFLQHKILWQLSELGINYKGSSLSSLGEQKNLKIKPGLGSGILSGERASQAKVFDLNTQKEHSIFKYFTKPGFHLLITIPKSTAHTDEKEFDNILNFTKVQGKDWIHSVFILSERNVDFEKKYLDKVDLLLDYYQEFNKQYSSANWPMYLIRPDGYVGFRAKEIVLFPLKKYWEDLQNL